MSTPAQPLSNAPATTMPMISPDGQIGDIPVEHADNASKAGFKHAVDMISPDGKHGTIPIENAEAAQKAGFRIAGKNLNMTGPDAALDNPSIQDLGHGDKAAGVAADLEGGKSLVQGGVGLAKAGVKALTAPGEGVAKTIGTGILDTAGNELKRDVMQPGPSILDKTMSTLQQAKPYVDGLQKLGLGAATIGLVMKALHDLVHHEK